MEYGTQVKVATIVLWNFFALIVNVVAFMIIYMKANKNASLKAFFVVQSSMMIWLIGKVLKTVSPNVELRWFFIVLYYFGICLLEVSFLDFAYIYNKGKTMHKIVRRTIYLIGIFQFLIVATNPYHYMFYSRFGFWGDDFGPLFYVHVIVNYLMIIIGMVLCSIKFHRQLKDRRRVERNIIAISILLPLIFNFIYITRVLEEIFDYLNIQVFDITPIIYTFSLLVFVYATFRYDFFDLTPIMKHEVSKKLEHPILILDKNRRIRYTNAQFDQLFQNPRSFIGQLQPQSESIGDQFILYNNKHYTYVTNLHKGIDGDKLIISFTDISSYELAKTALNHETNELAMANTKLENQIDMLKHSSHAGARNYIARELHDILGHSLVVTIKLLEVSKMYYKQNRNLAMESLKKAENAIKIGFNEMKSITKKDNSTIYHTSGLEKELRGMLKVVEISGIKVNFFLRGKSKKLDEKVYDTIKKVLTEIVTNTLKHGETTKFLIAIKVEEEKIIVQTMDNGIGVKNLVKGNGLIGIDGRLSLINGKVKYTSEEGEGFSSNISIPI